MTGFAQNPTIKGVVTDKTDTKPLAGATVSLLLQQDSTLVSRKVTDASGLFEFNPSAPDSFIVTVDLLNYQQYVSFFTLRDSSLLKEMGVLGLERQGTDLSAVTIVSKAAAVTQKGDTAQFSASQYKVNPDATTEDLIKKMPGITVDRNGTVTAQGEQVKKVTIDGKDFFGDDASAALKNLPSEIVDKIQVFDRMSDQAQQTGVDDGNTVKALNIVTKSGLKNGQFGRVYAGYGTDERYAAGGNASFFKGDRRLSFVGNFNNINQQNFGSQDLLGVTSSGGNRGGGGGRGGMGGGNFGGGNNFTVGQASGISKTNALGINFSNKYGPKLSLTASYFFNQSNINNETYRKEETFGAVNLFNEQQTTSFTKNMNHRFNMRLEYKLDSNNTIFFIPSVNIQDNESNSFTNQYGYLATGDSTNNSAVLSDQNRTGYNIRNNIMWRHSFAKKGRIFSLGVNTNHSKNSSDVITDADYRFYKYNPYSFRDSLQNRYNDNLTNNASYGANIAYVEPIGKKGQLQFEYNPNIQKNKADQQAFNYDGSKYSIFDPTLSNRFDNTITTHRAGITYRFQESRDAQFSIGLNGQATKLESEREFPTVRSISQNFSDLLPNAMYRKKFNAKHSVRLFYRANVNFPSVNQLQDVYDPSNSLRVSVGNPDLKQSNTHFLGGGYTFTNSKSGHSLFANFFGQTASDYIVNEIYSPSTDSTLQPGLVLTANSQLSRPVNMDGYRNVRGFLTYSMPIKFIKSNINLNAGVSYSRLPGMNNKLAFITDNVVYNTGVVIASNINEYIDFNINYAANFNNTKSTSPRSQPNNFVNQTTGVVLNLLNKKGWFVQNDVTNQTYSGLSAGLNESFWLWNAAIGKKFLKNRVGELKLSVFDLLKQNQAISRTVNNYGIEDSRNLVLQQYFMLTFTYNLKNFGTAKRTAGADEEGPRGMGGRPGGGGPGF
ncbi:MAG: TonB-dependent receptor [Chitinophagaceae bacterium]|nr:MAG: TonB-dependent receptor [Chitinophagaceae bacterium]